MGTLMRLATGFCVALARASASSAAGAEEAVAACGFGAGVTGASCAERVAADNHRAANKTLRLLRFAVRRNL